MTSVRLLVLSTLLLSALCQGSARAEGWSWRDWVPFAGKEESTAKKKKSSTPLLDGKPLRSSSKADKEEKPSMLARMGNGTRRMFSRTREALTFGDDDSSESKKGEGRHVSWDDPAPVRKKKSEEKSSWTSWFRRDEPRPSATVEDFMRQERPE